MGFKISRFACALAGGMLSLAAATPATAAETKPKIAVRAFAAKGVDPSTAATLETSFCTALGNEGTDVLCPDEVKAMVSVKQQAMGFGSCDDDEACTRQISKVTDSQRVVTGEVAKLGELYIVSVTLIDAETNKVLARASDRSSKLEDLLDKVNGLAKKLAAAK